MTRLEYLQILEQKLKKSMSQKDVDDIVRDYAEYFEDGKSQGKGEDEISAKLGNPEEVARQIIEENNFGTFKKSFGEKAGEFMQTLGRGVRNIFMGIGNFVGKLKLPSVLEVLLLIFIGIPVGIFILAIAAFVIILLISIIIGLIFAAIGLVLASIAMFAAAGFTLEIFYTAVPATIIVVGISILALGLFLAGCSLLICGGIAKYITRKINKSHVYDEFDPEEELEEPVFDFTEIENKTSEGSENND